MKKGSLSKQVSKNIAKKRRLLGWTQAHLAERIAVEKETVSRMETGKIALTLDRLEQCADLFGCSPMELVRDDSPEFCEQATIIADMLNGMAVEEKKAVVRFVAEATRLFRTRFIQAP